MLTVSIHYPLRVCLFTFTNPWRQGWFPSAFPPFAMIRGRLAKLRSFRGTLRHLVTPSSTDAVVPGAPVPWGSSSGCSTSGAVLLRLPLVHHLHQNPHVLSLRAWCLYTALLNTWVSLLMWLISYRCVVGHPIADSTSIGGPALAAGVLSRSFGLRSLHLYIRGFPFIFARGKASFCSYYPWIPLYPLVLLDLLSFRLERHLRPVSLPTWDLVKNTFWDLLSRFPCVSWRCRLRFCSLATAIRVGKLQAIFS